MARYGSEQGRGMLAQGVPCRLLSVVTTASSPLGKTVFILKKTQTNTFFLHKISCLGSLQPCTFFLRGTREGIRDKVVENDGLPSSLPPRPPCAEASPELETAPALLALGVTIPHEFIKRL